MYGNILDNPKVGPYMGIQADEVKTLDDGRRFRIILYGAYNAMGLIGSECNGIAILDEDQRLVLCDGIAQMDTGYFGASQGQRGVHDLLVGMNDSAFVAFVNTHPRSRYQI